MGWGEKKNHKINWNLSAQDSDSFSWILPLIFFLYSRWLYTFFFLNSLCVYEWITSRTGKPFFSWDKRERQKLNGKKCIFLSCFYFFIFNVYLDTHLLTSCIHVCLCFLSCLDSCSTSFINYLLWFMFLLKYFVTFSPLVYSFFTGGLDEGVKLSYLWLSYLLTIIFRWQEK